MPGDERRRGALRLSRRGPDGFCDAHRPGSKQVMAERGRRGAEASNRGRGPEGLEESELPEIDSLEDAEQFCAAVARGVALGRMNRGDAKAAMTAVREWRETHGERLVKEDLDQLAEIVETIIERPDEVQKKLREGELQLVGSR